MGVQDVVARLNKSKSANTAAATKTSPSIPKRKITTENTNKIFPPSPAASPTSTIHGKDNNINSNNSIASMLQKFGQPPSTLVKSQPTTTRTMTPTATPPESPVISLKPSAMTPPPTTTMNNKPKVTPKIIDYNQFDTTATEIVDLFQTLLDQNKAAEEYIEKLQIDVEKYSSDATKVRDYEIRVEYLALKLEQVSEERDYFEKELNELRDTNNKPVTAAPTTTTPMMSPAYTYQHDIIIEDEQRLQKQNNDAYMADILNVYEEISDHTGDDDGGDDMQLFDEQSQSQQQQECDRGMQIAIVKYVTDLETQKLETKALKQVVKKQDELITKLENKIKVESTDELLKEQVEVQRVELENKRELLAQLLNEREDLLRRLNSNQRKSRRSSIELISNIVNDRPASYSSITSNSGRGTPPLTAPPKQPLPPLPLK